MNRPTQTIRAFTLIELLAVMGIIAILGVVITTSAQRISKDAKVAGATNKVLAALGEARAIAIRDRAMVLVGFRVQRSTYRPTPSSPSVPDESKPQQIEIVLSKATGRFGYPGTAPSLDGNTRKALVFPCPGTTSSECDRVMEEFQLIDGIAPILLPAGIQVAGSMADWPSGNPPVGQDDKWISQPILKETIALSEKASMVVIRFGPDGGLLTRNPTLTASVTLEEDNNASLSPWIDFNRNGLIDIGKSNTGGSDNQYFDYDELIDEPLGNHTAFLAVFDSNQLHEQKNPAESWLGSSNSATLRAATTAFINQFSDRIHFNRFTGVAEIVPR
jgi:prepilin-type N-terminal cleavage/methylation domain-containing protein